MFIERTTFYNCYAYLEDERVVLRIVGQLQPWAKMFRPSLHTYMTSTHSMNHWNHEPPSNLPRLVIYIIIIYSSSKAPSAPF
jgi:hypothetical protein